MKTISPYGRLLEGRMSPVQLKKIKGWITLLCMRRICWDSLGWPCGLDLDPEMVYHCDTVKEESVK
jgi:hypothetical protein